VPVLVNEVVFFKICIRMTDDAVSYKIADYVQAALQNPSLQITAPCRMGLVANTVPLRMKSSQLRWTVLWMQLPNFALSMRATEVV
jgi:hypothetical protein